MARITTRIVIIFTAFMAVLALAAGAAGAQTTLGSLIEIDYASDDMGSSAVETSGATYNPSSNVLFTVDDEHNAYEFALNADGFVDSTVTPRIIDLDLGTDDFEGVAWIEGDKYAFLSEGSGEVIIATVPPVGNERTTITTSDIERSFPVIWGSWGNLGPEGLATDGEFFYVVREFPASLSKFEFDGTLVDSVSLSHDLADASGVAALADGTFLVISHESRIVAHYDINWSDQISTQLGTRDAGAFSQLEGIAVSDSENLHLFGEDNTRKGISGQTYSHLFGTLFSVEDDGPTVITNGGGVITEPEWILGDVNCSGTLSVADAIMISHFQVGLIEELPACGEADMNGDGRVSLTDAILVSHCSVGITNVGCPADI